MVSFDCSKGATNEDGMKMAKRQLTLASQEKKRVKDPNYVPEGELRSIVADELKKHPSFIREQFKEEIAPIADRLGVLEEVVRLIRNNMQTALRHIKKDTVEVKLAVDSLQENCRESKIKAANLKSI